MQLALIILLWILIGLSITTAGYWGVTLYHIVRTLVRIPSLRAGLRLATPPFSSSPPSSAAQATAAASPDTLPSVCIIVPAHNEERVIAIIIDALLKQDYPRFTVVFALDRCTDQTESIIRARVGTDPRFEILTISECPESWVGKVHALHVATTTSPRVRDAELLLFLDADTIPAPECLRAAVTLMRHRGDALLSVLSILTSDRWFERVVQPVAGIELFRQYPMIRANDHEDPRPFANGQFILVRRDLYEELGGHEAVKSEVLEDVWLARTFSRRGHHCGFYFAGDLLRCRMYEQWERFRRGWLRIYGECASRKPDRLRRAAIIVRLFSCLFPLASLVCLFLSTFVRIYVPEIDTPPWLDILGIATGISGFVIWLTAISMIYYLGRTPLWQAISSIVGAWLVGGLLLEAANNYEKGRPVQWGGKEYRREQR